MQRVSFSIGGEKTRLFIKQELGILFNDYSGEIEINDLFTKALKKRGIDEGCKIVLAYSGGGISRYGVTVLKNAPMDDDTFLDYVKRIQEILRDCLIR